MEIKEVTIGSVDIKKGISKSNREYTMVFITVDDEKYSMYCDNEWNKKKIDEALHWRSGDIKTLAFEQNGEYNNFDIPSKTDLLEARVTKLEEQWQKLIEAKKQKAQDLKKK